MGSNVGTITDQDRAVIATWVADAQTITAAERAIVVQRLLRDFGNGHKMGPLSATAAAELIDTLEAM